MTSLISEECQRFFEFWKSLRGQNKLMPSSSDFLDRLDPKYAPNLYIIDIEEDQSIIRFVGTRVVERWGRDRTGEDFFADKSPTLRRVFSENHSTAITFPCGVAMSALFVSNSGRRMGGRSITLPLDVDPGKPKRRVTYTQLVDSLGYEEVSRDYVTITNTEWVDIGAGVPDLDPIKAKED